MDGNSDSRNIVSRNLYERLYCLKFYSHEFVREVINISRNIFKICFISKFENLK